MSNARNLANLKPTTAGLIEANDLTATLDLSGKTVTLPSGTVPAPTTSEVLTATAGLTVGAVGTYALLAVATLASTITAGTTYSGADLRYAASVTNNTADNLNGGNTSWGSAPSGTWRAMGSGTASAGRYPITLFVRIS